MFNIEPLCTEEVCESLIIELNALTDEEWQMLNDMSSKFN